MPVASSSEAPGSPVILAAFSNDHQDAANYLRNLSEEARRIQAVLEPAVELCPLVLLPNATLDEILDAFQKYRNRVVVFHYAGHANGFELLLESASGGVHHVGAQGLATFLGQQQGLQLVFLNGCSTEQQAEALLNAGVGCVIATTQSIDDAVATDFSSRFYKGIVTGAPLQSAYAEAAGSAQAASGGSIDRLIRHKEDTVRPVVASRWPWLLKFKPGAERVAQWSLPEAAGDPLFGLPTVKRRDLPESPYRHLYRFEEPHAEIFFGRGREVRELYQRVTAPDSPPVVLFYGPAGVGKSSLLDAGLIPRLAGPHEVRYLRREMELNLGESLRMAFAPEFRNLSRRDAWIATEKQLQRPLVIVLDQVEEAFTKPHPQFPDELAEFTQLLRRIFHAPDNRPRGRLILGFRKEWFAEIDERLADAQVPRSRVFLERLTRRGAMEAITGPVDDLRLATHYKLTVEPGLPDLIADDLLADPETPVAPTLQILLTRMWSEACRIDREHPTFDTDLYQSLHRRGIMLNDFLNQQTEMIQKRLSHAVDSGFLLDLLEFHTTPIGTSRDEAGEDLFPTGSIWVAGPDSSALRGGVLVNVLRCRGNRSLDSTTARHPGPLDSRAP
ncbi:MAG: CHAT domain-containing protein [Planctomycetota bacterium]|nr:MAG: CHAT domain-containing protein [Planctomycetota bacterium]